MKKLKENGLTIYIILNILFILVGSFFTNIIGVDKIVYSTILSSVFLLTNIFIIIWLKRHRNIKHKVDIFIILTIVFALISTLFAYNIQDALNGTENRYEGLYMIIYYFSLFYISSYINPKHKKYIVYAILSTGFIQLLYAVCQRLEILNVVTRIHKGRSWAIGFVHNPNFFGTYMLLCLSYSLGLFIDRKNIKQKIIFLLLSISFLIGLIISDTLSVVVGLFIVLLFIIIYAIKFKKLKELIVILIIIPLVTLTVHLLGLTKIAKDLNVFKKETIDIVTNKDVNKDEYGTGRIYVWKETLKEVPKNLFTGIGIDNLKYIKNGSPIIRHVEKEDGIHNFAYDKSHNEYLQILITGGIFYLISYLIFYFIIVKNGIKDCFKNKEVYLILPVIGYLVQAFFNISVIEVAPLFYIALGLCTIRNKGDD